MRDVQGSVVNSAEVASSRRLMLFRFQRKAVDVDEAAGNSGVVLVGLHQPEVGAQPLLEAVVAIEQELGARHVVRAGSLAAVEPHVTSHGVRGRARGGSDRPQQLLHGVVEGQTDLLRASPASPGLGARKLELLNKEFVRGGCVFAPFVRIQINVVNIQRRIGDCRLRGPSDGRIGLVELV